MENIQSLTRMRLTHRASDIYEAKKIGVALGPGLPIGLVGVGLLIALKQLKLEVSLVSGTSMGAVIGALYASGSTPEEIREGIIEIFSSGRIKKLLTEDMKIPQIGFSTAEKLMDEIVGWVGWDPEFYELKVPLFIVVSDKVSQKSVILRHGRVFDAVRASMAMPLLIQEQRMGGMKLADGAIFAPLDTQVLYNESADFVFGMQAKPIKSTKVRKLPLRTKLGPHLLKLLGWQVSEEIYFGKPACDILLRPRVPQNLAKDGSHIGEIIDIGVKIVYDAFAEIEKGNFVRDTELPTEDDNGNIDEIHKQIEAEALDVSNYLLQLEKRVENLTDAELMDEFPSFANKFQSFLNQLSDQYTKPEVAGAELKKALKNLHDIVNQSPFMNRCLAKPRGYAGDYQMMNYIYDNQLFEAKSNFGKLLNYFFFASPTTNAVRNRAKIVTGVIQQRFESAANRLHIASIACGPAREVADTVRMLNQNEKNKKIIWTLLDQDEEALKYACKRIPNTKVVELRIINAGVRELIKKKTELGEQDIIYSLGLFDYLEEKVAAILINRLYSELKPGGLLLIGNFHPCNPLRILMEAGVEWYLIHRTEDELLELGKAGAPAGRHFVMAEPEGINLILATSKPMQT